MNFWKKLFGTGNKESEFAQDRKEMEALGLGTLNDLKGLVSPLVLEATKIEVQKASRPPENAQLKSHFGGHPYFVKGDEWPQAKNGKPLDFIFQVFNEPGLAMPEHIHLVQFFYDWEEGAWDTKDDGWLVKIHKSISKEDLVLLEKPKMLDQSKYCEIRYQKVLSLPDWEGVDSFEPNASKLSAVLDENEPWEPFIQVTNKLIGEQDYQSQLGGYPAWVQGATNPKSANGEDLPLLFQIDSENNAEIMWGDSGMVYVFYDAKEDHITFELQCL